MTRITPPPEVDLFGNPVETAAPSKPVKARAVTSDMDLIESVIKTARSDGYVVSGLQERVYRVEGKQGGVYEVAAAPVYEADAVRQLIEQNVLTVGGGHECRYHNNREGQCNAVLVPSVTRRRADRWAALQRPSNWKPATTGKEAS